jgi:hypothetical protein
MRKTLFMACAFFMLLGNPTVQAMGEKKEVPAREDKVTYAEVVEEHPQLKRMVDEEGFNSLSGPEQWDLIGIIDRYAFFSKEAEFYAGDRGSQATSTIYSQKARKLKKEIETRYGRVLKQ